MENQVTNNASALRLFFTEDVFLVKDETVEISSFDIVKPISSTLASEDHSVLESSLQPEVE